MFITYLLTKIIIFSIITHIKALLVRIPSISGENLKILNSNVYC